MNIPTFKLGDEVTVRCRVAGPSGLLYGDEHKPLILDLVPLNDRDEDCGVQFTLSIWNVKPLK